MLGWYLFRQYCGHSVLLSIGPNVGRKKIGHSLTCQKLTEQNVRNNFGSITPQNNVPAIAIGVNMGILLATVLL